MISDRMQLCLRLKQARMEAGLKQEGVGRYLQIPTSAVSAFESGNRKLDALELFMLAKLYRKPMGWFFGEEDFGPPQSGAASLDMHDPLIFECVRLMREAPRELRRSAAYGVIGFLSER